MRVRFELKNQWRPLFQTAAWKLQSDIPAPLKNGSSEVLRSVERKLRKQIEEILIFFSGNITAHHELCDRNSTYYMYITTRYFEFFLLTEKWCLEWVTYRPYTYRKFVSGFRLFGSPKFRPQGRPYRKWPIYIGPHDSDVYLFDFNMFNMYNPFIGRLTFFSQLGSPK